MAPLGVDPGHDVTDGAFLACSIHALEYQQQRIAVGCVVQALKRTQFLDMTLKELFVPFL
jgi:hypothetical protein